MGLLDKAKNYREKFIIESLNYETDFFKRKPVSLADLKILKEYYEKNTQYSSQGVVNKVSLVNLIVKTIEDVKYISSIDAIASSLYNTLSRLDFEVLSIFQHLKEIEFIYGKFEEDMIPNLTNVNYIKKQNENTFVKIPGEMGTYLCAVCTREKDLTEDEEMVLKRCIDILSLSLRLIQIKTTELTNFWGFRNAKNIISVFSILSDPYLDEKNKSVMLGYYFKEMFGLDFVIVMSEIDGELKPEVSLGYPHEILKNIKINQQLIGKNMNISEISDPVLSLLSKYGTRNIAIVRIGSFLLCFGAPFDLSDVIYFSSNI